MFYQYSPGHADTFSGNNNQGLVVWRDSSSKRKVIDKYGGLHSDITTQERYMLNGMDVKIRLTPSKHAFNQIGYNADNTLSVITHTSLFLRKVNCNPAISLSHAKVMEKTTAKYPLNRVVTKVFSHSKRPNEYCRR